MLSRDVSLSQYLAFEKARNCRAIADFAFHRFHERYIGPFKSNPKKNGFIMMASSCLMIEALESFWQGWKKSPDSALAFCQFFDRSERLLMLRGFSQRFYTNVRCGILHQGETMGGWRIRRDLKELFDATSLTIDATHFLNAMEGSLSVYRAKLKEEEWDAEVWKKFRKKMKGVCANARRVAN